MKLISLKTSQFGVLGDSFFDLAKESAIICGDNENGKSTFADALLTSLCGAPKATTSAGKHYAARYDKSAQASADLMFEGRHVKADQAQPFVHEKFSPEIFRNLLTVSAGEHSVAADKQFIEAFSDKVLNMGSIDFKSVLGELENVFRHDKKLAWHKTYISLNEAIENNAAALKEVNAQGGSMEERTAYEKNLEIITGRINELSEQKQYLILNRSVINAERAGEYLAKLSEYNKELAAISSLDPQLLETVQRLWAKKEADEKTLYKLNVLIENGNASLSQKAARKEKLMSDLNALPKRHLLNDVASSMAVLEQYKNSKIMFSFLGFAVSALIAAVPAGVLYLLNNKLWPVAFIGLTAVIAVVWSVLFRYKKIKEERGKLEDVLRRLGWLSYKPEQILTQLTAQQKNYDLREKELAAAEEQLVVESDTKIQYESEMLKFNDIAKAREAEINRLLNQAGLKEYSDITSKEARMQHIQELRNGLASEIKSFLSCDENELEKCLKDYIAANNFMPEEAAKFEHKTMSSLDAAVEENDAELALLTGDKEAVSGRLSELLQQQKHLEGKIGNTFSGLYAENQRLNIKLKRINSWRKAAQTTHVILSNIAGNENRAIAEAVRNAGALFNKLTGGVYEDIIVSLASPFDSDAIEVKHKTLGLHPISWLSTGAADLLWMALRITFAKSLYPEGAFMVLDEPFAMLDERRTEHAFSALLEMHSWQFVILTKDRRLSGLVSGKYKVIELNKT